MTEAISDAEIKAVRWGEHILPPLIVAALLTLATCMNQTQDAITQLQAKQEQMDGGRLEAKDEIRTIKQRQEQMLINVQKIDTNQGHFKEQILELKKQNNEMLRILRTQAGEHR